MRNDGRQVSSSEYMDVSILDDENALRRPPFTRRVEAIEAEKWSIEKENGLHVNCEMK